MKSAPGYGHVVVAGGEGALTVGVISPGSQGAVGFESQAVVAACGDGHVVVARGDVALPSVLRPQPLMVCGDALTLFKVDPSRS